jgi:Domain of unknown function (DUF4145)
MCRRVIDGICAHFGAKGRDLESKLANLKKDGILDNRIHMWADKMLRVLGNEAAHDVSKTISEWNASDALDFTKAILEHLFVLEAAFELHMKQREARKRGQCPPVPAGTP